MDSSPSATSYHFTFEATHALAWLQWSYRWNNSRFLVAGVTQGAGVLLLFRWNGWSSTATSKIDQNWRVGLLMIDSYYWLYEHRTNCPISSHLFLEQHRRVWCNALNSNVRAIWGHVNKLHYTISMKGSQREIETIGKWAVLPVAKLVAVVMSSKRLPHPTIEGLPWTTSCGCQENGRGNTCTCGWCAYDMGCLQQQSTNTVVVDPNFNFPWAKTMDVDRECLPTWFWIHLPSRALNSMYLVPLYIGLL